MALDAESGRLRSPTSASSCEHFSHQSCMPNNFCHVFMLDTLLCLQGSQGAIKKDLPSATTSDRGTMMIQNLTSPQIPHQKTCPLTRRNLAQHVAALMEETPCCFAMAAIRGFYMACLRVCLICSISLRIFLAFHNTLKVSGRQRHNLFCCSNGFQGSLQGSGIAPAVNQGDPGCCLHLLSSKQHSLQQARSSDYLIIDILDFSMLSCACGLSQSNLKPITWLLLLQLQPSGFSF